LHKALLEFADFGEEYAVLPALPVEALASQDDLKSWIDAYNASLPQKPAAEQLIATLDAYNAVLPAALPASTLAEAEASYAALPEALQTLTEDDKRTLARLKACIKVHNDGLPKPLKSKGSYAALLESYAAMSTRAAAEVAAWQAYPEPLGLGGSKADLMARIRTVDDTVQFADELIAQFKEANADKELLTQDEWLHVLRIREAVLAEPEAAMLLEEGVAEQSIYWRHHASGELLKCRPDWTTPDHILVDTKFVQDASPAGFARDGSKHNYHIQDAHYSEGYEAVTGIRPGFIFIAVQKDAPLGQEAFKPVLVGVYHYQEEDRERALALRDLGISSIVRWRAANYWPGYDGIHQIAVPLFQAAREKALIDDFDWSPLASDEQQDAIPTAEFDDQLFG